MASWVAPSIAADIWGVSLEHIMSGVADGSIQSRIEGQFLFVAIDSGAESQPCTTTPAEVVSVDEMLALTAEDVDGPEADLSQWRLARFQNSLLRRPPIAA